MRWFLAFVVLVLALGAGAAFYAQRWATSPVAMKGDRVEVEVKSGSGVRAIARQLQGVGVPLQEDFLVALARYARRDAVFKAGFYEVRASDSPLTILDKIIRGDFIQSEVRFVEGWTFQQMRKVLDEHPDVRKETSRMSEAQLLKAVGATEPHPEGLFFPDTYVFAKGSSDIVILRQAYQAMRKHLNAAWTERASNSPVGSPYQALVLASIIEKETGRKEDRSMVGAVFNNRLRIGMRLQADPTVIYGLGERFDGNLRKRDLQADTPYNTYTRTGLPPTPIAMPGLPSLKAALQPAQSEVLYFVARGDGSSQFSRTLEEHNQAVARYQRGGG